MLQINEHITIPLDELDYVSTRSQGPGGQHVNKVSSAVQIKFDIAKSSLPEKAKLKLLEFKDHRKTKDGIILIKAQNSRSQIRNREDAILRLKEWSLQAWKPKRKRIATKPTKASRQKRIEKKKQRSEIKLQRRKIL